MWFYSRSFILIASKLLPLLGVGLTLMFVASAMAPTEIVEEWPFVSLGHSSMVASLAFRL